MTCFVPRTSRGSSSRGAVSISHLNDQPAIPEPDDVKLTDYAVGLGCACKIRASELDGIVSSAAPLESDPNVLVGTESHDDASVVRISDDLATVSTTDFFPPIVNDAYSYGRISAANSLSDIYAMGAKPVTALSIVGFPTSKLPLETLNRILLGAKEKASEAGISITGGQTISTEQPLFGLAVTGLVHPNRFLKNIGAEVNDYLILTKPIGSGIITSALKRHESLVPKASADKVINWMATLNRVASEVVMSEAIRPSVHAMTDITGFGLLGHLKKMLGPKQSSPALLSATLFADNLPFYPSSQELIKNRGLTVYSTSSFSNADFVSEEVVFAPSTQEHHRLLLCDAQTSGGLLIAVSPEKKDELVAKLQKEMGDELGSAVRVIGKIESALPTPTGQRKPLLIRVENSEADSTTPLPESQLEQYLHIVVMDDSVTPPSISYEPHTSFTPHPSSPSSPQTLSRSSPLPTPQFLSPNLVWFFKNCLVTLSNDKLGKVLAEGMLLKLIEGPHIPGRIILMGDAIELSTINNVTVQRLQELERRGVEVLSCQTCLNMLKLVEKVRVGRAGTADEIAAILSDPELQIVSMS